MVTLTSNLAFIPLPQRNFKEGGGYISALVATCPCFLLWWWLWHWAHQTAVCNGEGAHSLQSWERNNWG